MAQSALTVTAPNPTPPTNLGSGIANTGLTAGTEPPTTAYASTVYNDNFHPGYTNTTGPTAPYATTPTVPPWLDDGFVRDVTTANPYPNGQAFAAVASGTAHEGLGTEVVVTQTYPSTIFLPAGALKTVSDDGTYTTTPNASHPSSLSGGALATATSLGTNNTASGAGTVSQTVTGTGFTPASVVYVNGVAQATTFTSATSITAPTVTKKATAGTWNVEVRTQGTTTAPLVWTFT